MFAIANPSFPAIANTTARDASRIASLEGLRGVAALAVVFFHVRYLTGFVGSNAYLFVDLFFVVSGFVMASVYGRAMNDGRAFGRFVWLRLGRLYPLFLFSTAVFIVARLVQKGLLSHDIALPLWDLGGAIVAGDAVGGLPHAEFRTTWSQKLAEGLGYAFMTHGLGFFDHDILNFPSWSISTEFYTYLIFGLICLFVPFRRRTPFFVVLAVGGAAISVFASIHSLDCLDSAGSGCLNLAFDFGWARCLAGFFTGCLVAGLPRPGPGGDHAGMSALQIGALVVILGAMYAAVSHPGAAFIAPPAMAVLVYSLAADRGIVARHLGTAPFRFLGEVSYSVYLMHMPVAMFFDIAFPRQANVGLAVSYVATLLIVSQITYRHIEVPARNWFRDRLPAAPRPPAGVPGAGALSGAGAGSRPDSASGVRTA